MPHRLKALSAGTARSVILTSSGNAMACGAIKAARPNVSPELAASICTTDLTEVGHNRFAQPLLRRVHPEVNFRSVSDAPLSVFGVTVAGSVLSCQPVTGDEVQTAAARHLMPGLPADVLRICAGASLSHALCADGAVWSWGLVAANFHPRREGRTTSAAPQLQAGLPPVADLAAGLNHAVALARDGRVWTWGSNTAGQLGQGHLHPRTSAQAIAIDARIVAVGAGDTHSFAVDDRGRLWAWGANNKGQLGLRDDRRDGKSYETRPVRVRLDAPVEHVDGGMFYSAARTRHGEVYTWGWNGLGQLGRHVPSSSHDPVPKKVLTLRNVRALSAGQGHLLALTNDDVFAWGDNRSAACGLPSSQAVIEMPRCLETGTLQETLAA